eukprot:CAMPEP_0172724258 /NCGR_PEP_ID=MMETSP1074-20121228/85548_1 /TAXON_ID=2916 /ORGANISM="Ceratium fusus, Strain PA161109" /LENGTH=93 /DNA_ID=CAMNT_0013550677 /DNA_START=53 /DNA_END=334 /DNA_ORIENTATION=+
MTKAWEALSADKRLPKSEEKSLYDDLKNICQEMINRWHSGESSHPDRESLAQAYPQNEQGLKALQEDLYKINTDPFVTAADLQLKLVKYTAAD